MAALSTWETGASVDGRGGRSLQRGVDLLWACCARRYVVRCTLFWLAHFMLLSLYLVLNEIEQAVDAPPDDLALPDDAMTPNAEGAQSSPRGGAGGRQILSES